MSDDTHETNEDLFDAKFWAHAWNDFFEDFSQPEFWKNAPGAAAQMDFNLDSEGKIIAIDGRPHVQMMLKKILCQDREEDGSIRFSLLKSTVVKDVLKKYPLHEMHQDAIENVRWSHRQKEKAVDIPVPPLLLAALIQYWQTTEAENSKIAKEMREIMEGLDNADYGGRVVVREGVIVKPLRSSEGASVVAGGKAAQFNPELLVRTETGRFSSQHPNEANKPGYRRGDFLQYLSSDTGRSTHKKPHCEQIDKDGNPIEKVECYQKVVLIEMPKEKDDE